MTRLLGSIAALLFALAVIPAWTAIAQDMGKAEPSAEEKADKEAKKKAAEDAEKDKKEADKREAAEKKNKKGDKKTAELPEDSLYKLKTKTLDGKDSDLKDYQGKVVLVVNVASKCGYTPQYKGLEKLYTELKDKNFVILGFPSNDFGGQEPGTAEDIKDFCEKNYGVTFPLFEKCQTKEGEGQSPVYANLKKQSGELPKWNFSKYLVGTDGKVIKFYATKTTPEDEALRKEIDTALEKANEKPAEKSKDK